MPLPSCAAVLSGTGRGSVVTRAAGRLPAPDAPEHARRRRHRGSGGPM